ncbi:MAG: hypothetical protein ACFCUW_03415 [Kiloniellaceae bacterium]
MKVGQLGFGLNVMLSKLVLRLTRAATRPAVMKLNADTPKYPLDRDSNNQFVRRTVFVAYARDLRLIQPDRVQGAWQTRVDRRTNCGGIFTVEMLDLNKVSQRLLDLRHHRPKIRLLVIADSDKDILPIHLGAPRAADFSRYASKVPQFHVRCQQYSKKYSLVNISA